MVQTARASRTQGERSAAMQRRLLDATIAALYEKGYGGTTTLEVQQRAGVSRGALLHHYSSRADLMVAAVEHLVRERMAEVLLIAQQAPPKAKRVEWAVRVLWRTFDGAMFTAALELWLAARNDEELLAVLLPQERILGQAIRGMAADLFGPAARDSADFPDALELVLDAMRGAASRRVLRTEGSEERLLHEWTTFMEGVLNKRQS
ncbi:MAG: TetR/AcrR family transcriptional regulator [Actinomycetota bacterium]|nr:TetR/AcrR family transcriptional regulator [Actinomycetota bacterium]